jgi:hypothetical protein
MRAEGRGQRAEGRGQRAEGRGQRAEGRGQRAEAHCTMLTHADKIHCQRAEAHCTMLTHADTIHCTHLLCSLPSTLLLCQSLLLDALVQLL